MSTPSPSGSDRSPESGASTIKSIYDQQDDILRAIHVLHCPEGFDADISYGNGTFWKRLPELKPKLRFDIQPQLPDVVEADSRKLPLADKSQRTLVFDPPFLCYVAGGRANATPDGRRAVMSARFGGYWTSGELTDHYRKTLDEAHRVLVAKGKLVFKCQDIIHNHRLFCTHANVVQWAAETGFRLRDLFILAATRRMPVRAASHGRQTQQHARIFHSYFLVFEKL